MQMTISQQLGLELNTVSNFFMNARRRCMNRWQEEPGTNPGVPSSSTSTFSKAWSFTPPSYIPPTPHSKALIPFSMRAMHIPLAHAHTSCNDKRWTFHHTICRGCFGLPQSPRGRVQLRPLSETLWTFPTDLQRAVSTIHLMSNYQNCEVGVLVEWQYLSPSFP